MASKQSKPQIGPTSPPPLLVDGPSAEFLLLSVLGALEYEYFSRCSYTKGSGAYRASALLLGALCEALADPTPAAATAIRRAAYAILRATGSDPGNVFEFHRQEFRESEVHDWLVDWLARFLQQTPYATAEVLAQWFQDQIQDPEPHHQEQWPLVLDLRALLRVSDQAPLDRWTSVIRRLLKNRDDDRRRRGRSEGFSQRADAIVSAIRRAQGDRRDLRRWSKKRKRQDPAPPMDLMAELKKRLAERREV